jgi:hypothetical protein
MKFFLKDDARNFLQGISRIAGDISEAWGIYPDVTNRGRQQNFKHTGVIRYQTSQRSRTVVRDNVLYVPITSRSDDGPYG